MFQYIILLKLLLLFIIRIDSWIFEMDATLGIFTIDNYKYISWKILNIHSPLKIQTAINKHKTFLRMTGKALIFCDKQFIFYSIKDFCIDQNLCQFIYSSVHLRYTWQIFIGLILSYLIIHVISNYLYSTLQYIVINICFLWIYVSCK